MQEFIKEFLSSWIFLQLWQNNVKMFFIANYISVTLSFVDLKMFKALTFLLRLASIFCGPKELQLRILEPMKFMMEI